MAWVVRDSLWTASSAPWGRRKVLAELWALRTLEAASIDMVYAPPLLAAQIHNVRNEHWVLRLLLVSPTRSFLCLVFDPLCNKPYIVGANIEELAIGKLIAEQEGIEPRLQKRWGMFLGGFGSVAFAIAPLYSTFLHQEDGVSCHPTCLVMLHCLLSRRVVNWHGCMLGPIVHPAVRRAFFATTQSTSRALNVEFISVPCMLPFCVPWRYVWYCAIGECNLVPHWHALYWHSRWVTGLWLTGAFCR